MIGKILLERFSKDRHHEIKSFQPKFREVKRVTEKIKLRSVEREREEEKELRRENNANEHMNINEETKAF